MASVTMGPDPTDVVGRRVVAWLLDNIIVGVGFFLLLYMFGLTKVPSGAAKDEAIANNWVAQILVAEVVWVVIVFVIRGALVGVFGWSPGKLMLGLRVVNWDGRPPGLAKGYVREVVNTAGQGLLGCLYDIPALFCAMNTIGHRQPADMASQTYVVDSYYLGRLVVRRSERTAAGPASVKREELEELLRESGVPSNFIPPNAKITDPFFEKSLGTYVVYNAKRSAWLKFDKSDNTWSPIDPDQPAIESGAGSSEPSDPFSLGPG